MLLRTAPTVDPPSNLLIHLDVDIFPLVTRAVDNPHLDAGKLRGPLGEPFDLSLQPSDRLPEGGEFSRDIVKRIGLFKSCAHALRNPRPDDVPQPCQLGIVGNHTVPDDLVEANNEALGDAGQLRRRCLVRFNVSQSADSALFWSSVLTLPGDSTGIGVSNGPRGGS